MQIIESIFIFLPKIFYEFRILHIPTLWMQNVKWTNIRHPQDIQDVFWTRYVRLSYALYPESN